MNKKYGVVQTLVSALVFFLVFAIGGGYGFAETKTDDSKKLKQEVEYVEVKTIPLYEVFKTRQKWYVTAYQLKEKAEKGIYFETSEIPAKLCFWYDIFKKEQLCSFAEEGASRFQKVENLSVITLQKSREPRQGVLFITGYLGPTVGMVRFISVWVYNEQKGKFVKVLPSLYLTDQGEYKIISAIDNREGILIAADRIWKNGEPLYGSHQFRVKIYKYSEDTMFKLVGEYETKIKYQSLDDVDTINVIEPELSNIKQLLEKTKTY